MFNFKFYLLPLLILSIGLSGCTKLNKDVSKTLSIVIEPAFKEQVLDAVKYATSKNNSLEFEIKILSPDPDKRSAEIQKLRTQIMSGKGPDLYLVNCSTDGAAQMNEPLFERKTIIRLFFSPVNIRKDNIFFLFPATIIC